MVRALCGLVLAALVACGGGRKEAVHTTSEQPPVLVIAVDGLEWDVLLPLLHAGRLPALAALMERGTAGLLETIEPTLSPVVWTSIATGKRPEQHGILGFAKPPATPDGKPALYSNLDRRTKAVWNVASEWQKRVGVVGWWMTYPADPVRGVLVAQTNTTDQLDIAKGRKIWKGGLVSGVPGQVFPPERQAAALATLDRVDRELPALTASIFGRFQHPHSALGTNLWSNCQWSFRADETYLRIALDLLALERFDLFLLYLGGPDVVGHRFWRYRDPALYRYPPEPGEVADFHNVIDDYYLWIDRAVGQLVAAAGPRARVVIVSDHGMRPVNLDKRFDPDDPPVDVTSAHHLDGPPGVIIAAGTDIRHEPLPRTIRDLQRADLRTRASVLDVAPTLLELLDVPVGADFAGHVAESLIEPAFLAAHPVRTVPTHDTPEWLEQHRRLAGADPGDEERIRQLRALGYVQ